MSFNPQQPNSGRPMPPNYAPASGPQQPYSQPTRPQQTYSQQPGAHSYSFGPSGSGLPGYGQPGVGQPGPGQPGYGQPGFAGPLPVADPALFDSRNLPDAAYGSGSAAFWMAPEQDRTTAMWSQLGAVLFGYLPLIMFLIKKDESPFVREHTRQGLNAMITSSIATIAALFVFGGLGFGLAFFTFGLSIFLIYTALIVPCIYIVFYIIAGVAANRGEGYKIPLVFEFVK